MNEFVHRENWSAESSDNSICALENLIMIVVVSNSLVLEYHWQMSLPHLTYPCYIVILAVKLLS